MSEQVHLRVCVKDQRLYYRGAQGDRRYVISTAKNGIGQQMGSFKTPSGTHRVFAKIGAGLPKYSVFKGRRWTGEIWTPSLGEAQPDRDWILSRIIWLQGQESGHNLGGLQDSKRRFIYFHGTNEEQWLGQPCSHGCIRMSNQDVIELFDLVACQDQVIIR